MSENFTKQIEEWDEALGLKVNLNYEVLCEIQSLTKAELDILSAKEAANYVFILQQFSFDIQKHHNKCQAFLSWIRGKPSDAKLIALKDLCLTKSQYIFFMSKKIENLAMAMAIISKTR